ncbi:hypothetical protein EDB85DRAFT_201187 [Lactarius pseudohatsudake]|nr:hypothetical protein EDB85DRAFT_201187 [Lactarius pseudohatsudake]
MSWPNPVVSKIPTSLRISAARLKIKVQGENDVQVGDGSMVASVLQVDDVGYWWWTCTFQCTLLPRVGSCSYGWMSNFRPCYAHAQTLDFTTNQKCRLRCCTTILLIAERKPEFLVIYWSRLQIRVRPRIQPDCLRRSKSSCIPLRGARHVAPRFSYSTPATLPYNGGLACTTHRRSPLHRALAPAGNHRPCHVRRLA